MRKPFFSIGIIFKNEIRCLERCLTSLQPLRDAVPCEVVMADTGSTDGSREIAEKYADVLFDFPWIDDFAAARNAVMDRCSGTWYFSIDADEWLDENVAELVQFSKVKAPHDFAGVNIRNYRSAGLAKDQNYMDFIGLRMARLSTGIRYDGIIHETWHDPAGGILKMMPLEDTWLYHDGYIYATKEAELAKNKRNMNLLRRKHEADPKNFQTLLECIDSSKHVEKEVSVEYTRQMVAGLGEKWPNWERFCAVIMHSAVSVAQLNDLPELEDWIDLTLKLCPDSIFSRVDLPYYAFAHYWEKKDYKKAVEWGEIYRKGMEDFNAKRYDNSELIHGVLDYASPFWERKLCVLLPQGYLECDEPEKAFSAFQELLEAELHDAWQVGLCTLMLIRLHRTALLDTPALMKAFWAQINQPIPDEEKAAERRKTLLNTASSAFSDKYIAEELDRSDFLRHGYTVFLSLEDCPLGRAAAMRETDDVSVLEETLAEVTELEELPVDVLFHALEAGVPFPLAGHPMFLEEMDLLASRLSRNQPGFIPMVLRTAEGDWMQNRQRLTWTRGLALSSILVFGWTDPAAEPAQGLAVAKMFARTEKAFLACCYAPEALHADGLFMLPSSHRFGWYCIQAFEALEQGDAVSYVQLLRKGLAADKTKKHMVEFLINNTPELQTVSGPSAELQALADQIRAVLANFAPDDPAVAVLKQSEAYQTVAYLIEGFDTPVVGGLLQ